MCKVLGEVQSTKCFCVEVRNRAWVIHLRCQKYFVPRYSFCRHPLSRPQCYLFRIFPKRQKKSKNLNTSSIVSIVRTATSVTKMISRKYKLNSVYLKERCWSLWTIEINYFWPYPMLRDTAVCPLLPWCLLRIVVSVNVPPGHQRDRKKSEKSICVWKTLLLLLTSTIVFGKINRISLNC